ncbi:18 kDa heat shock protein [Philodulcilactobacillus myokoensis]|uniref:18 kDa heat shock protein n=1 Tax=Philodulcilactobacillus myokoensis TaxID=2929573 RepID=A0A9W6ET21_9LACO|nr:Hsp20/alpha crystallin family protein [Philodulcilactobacillus myokoensis]GLB47375.1 18 kDa heat shock protein [Philodulcilactobacillus myokoensis]
MANDLRNRNYDMFGDPMDNFFGNFGKNMFNSFANSNEMKTDVVENKDNFQVTAELPGFKKDNIDLDYHDNNLNIRANHDLNKEAKDNKGNVLRKERSTSNVARSFYLPHVDFNNISASYDGGLLKITLPKESKDQRNGHSIDIK